MKKDFLLQGLDHLCCGGNGLEELISGQALQLAYSLLDSDRSCDPASMIESLTLRIMLYIVNGKLYEADDENFLEIWRTFNLRYETYSENWSDFVPFVKRFQSHRNLGVWERTNLHLEYQRSIINRYVPSVKILQLFHVQLNQACEFIMLIIVRMPTIVGIFTFTSIIKTTSECYKARKVFIFRHFSFVERLKFHAQFS